MPSRRQLLQILGGVSAGLLAGCATNDPAPLEDSRTYCLKTARLKKLICTPERIPPAAIEAEAKRFEPVTDAFTLYVVRWSWVDAVKPLAFVIDATTQIVTLPKSLVRLRLSPGRHQLHFEWDGAIRRFDFEARVGEVKFVEIAGSATPWDQSFYWSDADPAGARERANGSRLIADI